MKNSTRNFLIILAVATVIAAAVFVRVRDGSGPGGPGDGADAGLTGETFATWDAFLEQARRDDGDGHKVVFIGLDGAAWNIIDPMIDAGALPTMAKLKQEGAWGTLRSVDCYVSPPAWTTMMTGFLPETTGIYTFGHWDAAGREFLPLSSEDVRVPSVWDISSLAGRRTAVVNVPVTYPVREVDGIMISGLMTPVTLAGRETSDLFFRPAREAPAGLPPSESPVLTASLDHAENRLEFFLCDTAEDRNAVYNRVQLRVYPRARGETAPERSATYDFDVWLHSPWIELDVRDDDGDLRRGRCRIRVLPTGKAKYAYVVWFSLTLSSIGDADVPLAWPASLVEEIEKSFDYYFPSQFLDREMVPDFTRDAAAFASYFRAYDDWDLFLYVFTQTDNIQHMDGASPLTRSVYRTIDDYLRELINTLPDNATLIIASDHGFREYSYSLDLNEYFEQLGLLAYTPDGRIDHDRTLVFHNLWCIYLNRDRVSYDALRRLGIRIPSGASPADALVRHLELAGRNIGAADGTPFPVELKQVTTRVGSHAPDMIVSGTYGNYLVEFWNIDRPQGTVLRALDVGEQWNHTREGIYVVYGKGVRRGYAGPVRRIEDIAPTMLYLLGLPVSEQMDGKVMAGVFDDALLAERPLNVVRDYGQVPRRTAAVDEERESLEKKLRSLGYIR